MKQFKLSLFCIFFLHASFLEAVYLPRTWAYCTLNFYDLSSKDNKKNYEAAWKGFQNIALTELKALSFLGSDTKKVEEVALEIIFKSTLCLKSSPNVFIYPYSPILHALSSCLKDNNVGEQYNKKTIFLTKLYYLLSFFDCISTFKIFESHERAKALILFLNKHNKSQEWYSSVLQPLLYSLLKTVFPIDDHRWTKNPWKELTEFSQRTLYQSSSGSRLYLAPPPLRPQRSFPLLLDKEDESPKNLKNHKKSSRNQVKRHVKKGSPPWSFDPQTKKVLVVVGTLAAASVIKHLSDHSEQAH